MIMLAKKENSEEKTEKVVRLLKEALARQYVRYGLSLNKRRLAIINDAAKDFQEIIKEAVEVK